MIDNKRVKTICLPFSLNSVFSVFQIVNTELAGKKYYRICHGFRLMKFYDFLKSILNKINEAR